MAFVLDSTKPAADEVRRVAVEELDKALRLLANPHRKGLETTVHSVRKSCKRVRALVRLVRPALGAEYQRTNHEVRDASATLSSLRDAHATLATFDALRAARPDLFPKTSFGDVRDALDARAKGASTADSAERFTEAAGLLTVTAAHVDGWRLKVDLGDLIDGAADYHDRARRAFRACVDDASDEAVHEWRKRVKDGWYHTQLLCPIAPSFLNPAERALSDLSDALGDSNDLAVLSGTIGGAPDEFGGDQAVALLEVIQLVRDEMFTKCRPLGARLYAESEREYRSRLRRYAKADRLFGPEQRVRGIDRMFPTSRLGR